MPLPLLLAAALVIPQQSATFRAPDGSVMPADVYGSGERGVVIVGHGGYSSRKSWAPQARAIADAGFHVLVFETRAAVTLAATGKETDCLYDPVCMAGDVLAAVRHLRRLGARSVAILAGSAGGGAAAQATVEGHPGEIDRLVLLAPMSIATPEQVRARTLVITAEADRSAAGPRLPVIRAQFDRMPQPKAWLLVSGDAHGQRLFDSPAADRVMVAVLGFLKAT